MTPLAQLADRVERLLLRHRELQRTNELLTRQLDAVSLERDQLKERLGQARLRLDEVLARLPQAPAATEPTTRPNPASIDHGNDRRALP